MSKGRSNVWKLRPMVDLLDPVWGVKGDGVTDDAPAIQAVYDHAQTRKVFWPTPAANYRLGSKITITRPVWSIGEGPAWVTVVRDYSPADDFEGAFNFRDGGTFGRIEGMSIVSQAARNGGCLISIKPTAAGALGQFRFDNLYLTSLGNDTHQYSVYIDGSAKDTGPLGVRGVDFVNCHIFGAAQKAMLWKSLIYGSFTGGSVNAAGGTSGNVQITGTATVPSFYSNFKPGGIAAGFDLDRLNYGSLVSPTILGNITNTANTFGVNGEAYVTGSVDTNWISSGFRNTAGRLYHDADGRLRIGDLANLHFDYSPASGLKLRRGTYVRAELQGGGGVGKLGHVGGQDSFLANNGTTFTFNVPGGGKLFYIFLGSGAGALFFADYLTAAITILSNPAAAFANSAAPGPGLVGVYKAANSHSISVLNNTGAQASYAVQVVGYADAVTDPA